MAAFPRARRLARRPKIATTAVSLAAVLALTLAGCGSDSEGGSSSAEDSADASYGEISMQYSWIKNEEFAGEFYADENGYYDEAGFDAVNGISGPDTGVAKLLSGTVQVALSDAASIGAAIAEQDAPLKIIGATFQKNPFTILSLKDGGDITTPAGPDRQEDRRPGLQRQRLRGDPQRQRHRPDRRRGRAGRLRPDPADERRGRRLHGLPDQRGASPSSSPATRSRNLPYADNGVPYVAETFSVTDAVPRREQGPAEGVPDRRDQGLDRRLQASRPTTRST